jgi:2'-hydroxyisoflavone reductase
MPTTRRHFIQSTLAASLLSGMAGHALAQPKPDPKPESKAVPKPASGKKLNILILGGTGFLGPAIVEAAQREGHALTLFNRGQREKVKGTYFEGAEHLYGNRDPNKHADEAEDKLDDATKAKSAKGLAEVETAIKAGKTWDAVIDTSGYAPRIVKTSTTLLAPATKQYVFISTVSVYAKNDKPNEDESAELAKIDDPTIESMGADFHNYGPLKALCEKAAEEAMPGRVTNIRPGFIVGIRDDSDRFTYWPVRTSEGGELLTPGDPKDPVQYIDVRDLAAFVLTCIKNNTRGIFNATSPSMPWGGIITACVDAAKAVSPDKPAAKPVWVPNDWLASNGLPPGSLPIYIPPDGEDAGFHQRSVAKAVAAGMTIRPTIQTAKEILQWWPSEVERRVRVTKEMKEKAAKEGKPEPKMPDPTLFKPGIPVRAVNDDTLKKWHEEQKK